MHSIRVSTHYSEYEHAAIDCFEAECKSPPFDMTISCDAAIYPNNVLVRTYAAVLSLPVSAIAAAFDISSHLLCMALTSDVTFDRSAVNI
jgi:hypothetical protein